MNPAFIQGPAFNRENTECYRFSLLKYKDSTDSSIARLTAHISLTVITNYHLHLQALMYTTGIQTIVKLTLVVVVKLSNASNLNIFACLPMENESSVLYRMHYSFNLSICQFVSVL